MSDHVRFPKVQKYLAELGIGSRRTIEAWIADEALYIDGQRVTIGMRIDQYGQHIVQYKEKTWRVNQSAAALSRFKLLPKVLAYNKPEGVISARVDNRGRPTVFEQIPPAVQGRWINVGRLDCNTKGLLLFTTSGELAYRLMHPSYQLERVYKVRIRGKITRKKLLQVKNGMWISSGAERYWSRFAQVVAFGPPEGNYHWFQVALFGGRYREVRALWNAVDLQVTRLLRIQYGPIQLPSSLRPGHSMYLTEQEVYKLCSLVHLASY